MNVVAYCRVSTSIQSEEGVSLQAQEQKLRRYAEVYDLNIVEMVIDPAVSGKSLDRPKLQHALGLLGNKADALLIPKLDRLSRSVRDMGDLIDRYFRKHTLLSVDDKIDTSTAVGVMMINIITTFAQFERESISDRTRCAMRYMREQGKYAGGRPPYGYRVEAGALVPVPAEQAKIREMRALRAQGVPLYEIAKGIRSRKGTPISISVVKRLVA